MRQFGNRHQQLTAILVTFCHDDVKLITQRSPIQTASIESRRMPSLGMLEFPLTVALTFAWRRESWLVQ
jgi:hypothetical protein